MSIDPAAFIHPLAYVCGDVHLGAQASVWPTAVLRGDSAVIIIGAQSNVQDGCVIHVDPGVTIGHRAVVHGARIHGGSLVGMGAIVLNGAVVGGGSIIGAGAVVREGMVVPPNSLVVGVPGRVLRETTAEERARIERNADAYVALQRRHLAGEFPPLGRAATGDRPGV
jgi:carbonic anhydrase/acetyltransferase-like protein (isoleucine patch superfamily)